MLLKTTAQMEIMFFLLYNISDQIFIQIQNIVINKDLLVIC